MKKTIVFLVKSPSEIPSRSTNDILVKHQSSDFFFAKAISFGGNEINAICCYDFKNEKWLFTTNGVKEIIEYYICDEKLNKWLHSDAQDVDVLLSMFNAMDECDR